MPIRTRTTRAAADRHRRLGRRRQVDPDRAAAATTPSRSSRTSSSTSGQTSERRGDGYLNLALLTDGLRAEREQGITIDVAYRYFQTPRRKFIIADTPGHEQYTRNMVTGASTADLSIVLIDARKGVSEQTRRHAYISSLLRIPHVVVCVNKMDLVDYDEAVFYDIVEELSDWAARLQIPRHDLHPDLGAEGRQRGRRARRRCSGTAARRCSTTSSTWSSPRTAISTTSASPCSG